MASMQAEAYRKQAKEEARKRRAEQYRKVRDKLIERPMRDVTPKPTKHLLIEHKES